MSTDTFIATPTAPPENVQPDTNKKNATELLAAIWDAVEKVEEQAIRVEHLHALSITQQAYQDAHSALASRNTVIFKRGIADIWVNPYNKHLLKA